MNTGRHGVNTLLDSAHTQAHTNTQGRMSINYIYTLYTVYIYMHINMNDTPGIWSVWGTGELHMKFWSENKMEWRHLHDLGVEGRQFQNVSYINRIVGHELDSSGSGR